MSEHHNDPMRTWKLTPEEVEEEELSMSLPINSSAAWYCFEDFFASRGYDLRYDGSPTGSPDDERCMPRRPKVNFDEGLGNPFKPCREKNLPYVFHDPSKYPQAYERLGASGIWSLRVPRITYAYDKYHRIVIIKAIPIPDPSAEIQNILQLNAEPLRSCPDNHTIPVLEHIISDEGWQFLVMPAWKMQWDDWLKAWEIEDYFIITIQLLEGLAFMHKNGFAHCDISVSNVVFNSDKTSMFSSRLYQPIISQWDFRAAYIDFGFSLKFDSSTDPSTWTSTSPWGTWPHISPEKEAATTTGTPYKTLPADVYSLGTALKGMLDIEADSISQARQAIGQSQLCLSRVYANEVLKLRVPEYDEVLQKMMANDPDQRPTADETLQLIRDIQENLPRHIRFAPPGNLYYSLGGHSSRVSQVRTAVGEVVKDVNEDILTQI